MSRNNIKIEKMSEKDLDEVEFLEIEYLKERQGQYLIKMTDNNKLLQGIDNFPQIFLEIHGNNPKYKKLVEIVKRKEAVHPTIKDLFFTSNNFNLIVAKQNNRVVGFAFCIKNDILDIYAINNDNQILEELRKYIKS